MLSRSIAILDCRTCARMLEARRRDQDAGRRKGRLAAGQAARRPNVLAMIFDKPSTRTRVSFDVGMRELGGETLMLTGNEMQLGRGETIADTARVLSRFVDAIMIRILDHEHAHGTGAPMPTVPVINGLTKRSHPCQVMADIMTFEEHRGADQGPHVAWSGDSNNVLRSWIHAAAQFGFTLDVASPAELAPRAELDRLGKRRRRRSSTVMRDPYEAVPAPMRDLRLLGVDGRRGREAAHNLLAPYQVNAQADGALRRRTRSSCIACRRIAARKSPTR